MTATLEQTKNDLANLIERAREGEEVLITKDGVTVAKLTGVPTEPSPEQRREWGKRLAQNRARYSTGKSGRTTDEILQELRTERDL